MDVFRRNTGIRLLAKQEMVRSGQHPFGASHTGNELTARPRSEFSDEEKSEIKAGALRMVAEDAPLKQLRSLVGMTQNEVADRLDIAQNNVSQIERRDDIKISTLQSYVEALCGELAVAAIFPDKGAISLDLNSSDGIIRTNKTRRISTKKSRGGHTKIIDSKGSGVIRNTKSVASNNRDDA